MRVAPGALRHDGCILRIVLLDAADYPTSAAVCFGDGVGADTAPGGARGGAGGGAGAVRAAGGGAAVGEHFRFREGEGPARGPLRRRRGPAASGGGAARRRAG